MSLVPHILDDSTPNQVRVCNEVEEAECQNSLEPQKTLMIWWHPAWQPLPSVYEWVNVTGVVSALSSL